MHLPERLKEERRCLRLRLNGGRYAFDEEGEKPRILVPVQLQGARDDLGMHYSLRRFAHLFSVREFNRHRAGLLGPEEFVAMMPPIVAPFSAGSMPRIWSESASCSCKVSSFIPAWTRTI